jgi:hypothetical protein
MSSLSPGFMCVQTELEIVMPCTLTDCGGDAAAAAVAVAVGTSAVCCKLAKLFTLNGEAAGQWPFLRIRVQVMLQLGCHPVSVHNALAYRPILVLVSKGGLMKV